MQGSWHKEQEEKRNEFESVVVRWMNLEPVIQSEISQKEKNVCVRTHVCVYMESKTNATDESICRAGIEGQT